jgi:hypothetical protein
VFGIGGEQQIPCGNDRQEEQKQEEKQVQVQVQQRVLRFAQDDKVLGLGSESIFFVDEVRGLPLSPEERRQDAAR